MYLSDSGQLKFISLDVEAGPTCILFWHDSRSVHPGLGLHPEQHQEGISSSREHFLWARFDRSLHDIGIIQLSASATWWEFGEHPARWHLQPTQAPPGVRAAHASWVDDARSAWSRTLCRLPVQRHRRKLGTKAAGLGYADGQLSDRERYPIQRDSGTRPVPGSGSGEAE